VQASGTEAVILESRHHMDVIMPDILTSGRLVVFPDGYAVAPMCGLDGKSQLLGYAETGCTDEFGENINVLEMSKWAEQ